MDAWVDRWMDWSVLNFAYWQSMLAQSHLQFPSDNFQKCQGHLFSFNLGQVRLWRFCLIMSILRMTSCFAMVPLVYRRCRPQSFVHVLTHWQQFQIDFLIENVKISIKISLKFVPKSPINNIPALVQIMVWRRPGTCHNLNQWWLTYWRIYACSALIKSIFLYFSFTLPRFPALTYRPTWLEVDKFWSWPWPWKSPGVTSDVGML